LCGTGSAKTLDKKGLLGGPVAQQDADNTLLVANLAHPVEMVHHGEEDERMDHHLLQMNLGQNHFEVYTNSLEVYRY
jgi:hypothetical protein